MRRDEATGIDLSSRRRASQDIIILLEQSLFLARIIISAVRTSVACASRVPSVTLLPLVRWVTCSHPRRDKATNKSKTN